MWVFLGRICGNYLGDGFAVAEHTDALTLLDLIQNLGRVLPKLCDCDSPHLLGSPQQRLLHTLAHHCANC